ncbi:MAG: tetratricopeptide repeat protein [Candidatus Melainabacteria bacterium]|nr:tetratricopeptide repeat protein [Candidatus Melainabacteria bacterium]
MNSRRTKPEDSDRSIVVPLALMILLNLAPNSAEAKKKGAAVEELPAPTLTKSTRPDSPECVTCVKDASKLFAVNKSMDALKLLKANQANCKTSIRFNLLLSTILLRMPSQAKEAAEAAALAVSLDPSSLPANFQLAICQTASGDRAQALKTYEKVVALDPTNYEAWSALGTMYEDLNDKVKAKSAAAKASILEPDSRTAKVKLAQNMFKQGRDAAVAAELDKLISDDHLEPEFFIPLAKDAIDMLAFNESIRAADRALGAYPKLADVIKTKAKAQFYARKYADGLATISKLEPRSAGDTEASAVKAALLLKLGRTKEAQPYVSKLPNNPNDELAGLARAYMAQRNGETAEAIEQLENAMRHNQLFAPAHIELARIYLRQGRNDDVIEEAREIARSRPYIASGKSFESRLALEEAPLREKVELALKLAREAVKLNGDDPEALIALALSELKGGKIESAQVSIKKALEIEPGNIDALLAKARLLEGSANSDKRIAALEAIEVIAPGDSEVAFALSQAYCEKGDMTAAIKMLRGKLTESKSDAVVVFALGKACERSGRGKEAAKYYKQSLAEGLKGQRALLAREALQKLGTQPADDS